MERYLSPKTVAQLTSQPKPASVCGQPVPDSLDDLTFGDLMALQNIKDNHTLIEALSRIVLKTPPEQVLCAPATEVFGLVSWIGKEVERINKLFEGIKTTPSDDERAAGIESLSFGVFGVADWYARRMGMTDQDDALKIKWVRIFECMRMDNEVDAYGRRLREIISKKK